jgi:hypothetical protein
MVFEVVPTSWIVNATIVRANRMIEYTFLNPIISTTAPQMNLKVAPHRKLVPATFVRNSSSEKLILP